MGLSDYYKVLTPLVAFALFAIAAIGAADARNESQESSDGKGQEALYGLDYIPLRGNTVDIAVRSIVMIIDGSTYLVETKSGLEVKSQDKLPLSRIPIIGQLTDSPYERADFADDRRIGDVAADGTRLIVNIRGTVELPTGVTVLNQENAYILDEKPATKISDIPFVGPVIGGAFLKPEDRTLLIMVRPSIVLDGGLF